MSSHSLNKTVAEKISDALILTGEQGVKARCYHEVFGYSLDEQGNSITTPKRAHKSKLYTKEEYNNILNIINSWNEGVMPL